MKQYNPTPEADKRRDNNFTYYVPKEGQAEKYTMLRNNAKELAKLLELNCPPSRELSVALTKLEEVMFWANASVARNE